MKAFSGALFAVLTSVLLLAACVTTGGPQITITPGDLALLEGETENLDYVLPEAAAAATDEKPPVWTSENPKIAVVTPKGMVVALKEGVTTITVTASGFSGTVKVTVVKPTVRFENIWISKILYEKDGKAMYGTPLQSDPSSQWIIEEVKENKRIRNKATGHYLSSQNGLDYVECLAAPDTSPGSLWKIEAGSIAGGNTFQSVKDPGFYLHVEQKKGYAQCSDTVQPGWTSPQWKIVKMELSKSGADEGKGFDTLVKNGAFSKTDASVPSIKGVNGTAFWSFDGKAKTLIEDGIFRADVQDPSGGVSAVRLYQSPIALEKGKTYVISFMAKASADRSLKVKVGGSAANKDKDYSTGGTEGTEVALNTEMNPYSLLFTMTSANDAEAALVFLLGGVPATSVWIDNIMFEEFPLNTDQVKNGDFSKETEDAPKIQYVADSSYWFFGYDQGGAGGFAVPAMDQGAIKVIIKDPGREVYAIQLIQNPMTFVQGATYRVSFDAKSSAARTIDVKAGGMGERNWADYTGGEGVGQIVQIGTEMKNHAIQFEMKNATDHNARLEFQLGGVKDSEVWLDNIKVVPVALSVRDPAEKDIAVWVPSQTKVTQPDLSQRGARLPFRQYEAEDAATNGRIIGPERAGWTGAKIAAEALGRKAVALAAKGDYVEFTLSEKANALVIRYSIPDSADGKGQSVPVALYVNGQFKKELVLTSEYAWIYGNFPGTNKPSDGSARRFFDEISFLTDEMASGSRVKLQKDASNALEYTIDMIDAEFVAPPLAQPAGTLSITDFGAVKDDAGDDSVAINKCVEKAMKEKKGVWIPAGTFRVKADNDLYPDGVTVQGAGMWHTVIRVEKNGFYGSAIPFTLRDLAVFGSTKYRDDSVMESGVHGKAGKGSLIENVWFNHLKVGIWSEKETDGLTVRGCRFRNTLADGINLCLGTVNSTVEQCHFRGTGDDAIATWSARYNKNSQASSGNIIRFNTIQSPWLANGIAVYGGSNHVIEDNLISDIVFSGAGINLSSNFDPVPFSGTITVRRNTLIRCGAENSSRGQNTRGALWIWCQNQDIDADLLFQDLEIYDSTFAGISIEGRSELKRARFENILIRGAGTWGIHIMGTAKGRASFKKVVVEDAVMGGLLDKGEMTLDKDGTDKGW